MHAKLVSGNPFWTSLKVTLIEKLQKEIRDKRRIGTGKKSCSSCFWPIYDRFDTKYDTK